MGNNAEIRQRMETYRSILLIINWIGSIIGIITGFVLLDRIGGYAFIIVIISFLIGIIGHFLINVALAIPFILLNNGDIMEKQAKLQKQLLINFGVSDQIINEIIENDMQKKLHELKIEETFETKSLKEIEIDKEKIKESVYYQMEYKDLLDKLTTKFPVSIARDIENIEEKHGLDIAKKVMVKKLLE